MRKIFTIGTLAIAVVVAGTVIAGPINRISEPTQEVSAPAYTGSIMRLNADGSGGRLYVKTAPADSNMRGRAIPFRSDPSTPDLQLGDGVTFGVVGGGAMDPFASTVRILADVVVIDEDLEADLVVGPHTFAIVAEGATVHGDVVLDGGTFSIVGEGASVTGNVTGTGNGGILLITDGGLLEGVVEGNMEFFLDFFSTVNGSVEVDGENVFIQDSLIKGNFFSRGSGGTTVAIIDFSTINGNVEVGGNQLMIVWGNEIDGNINSDGDDAIDIAMNTVNGSITVTNTVGICSVVDNMINGSVDAEGCLT